MPKPEFRPFLIQQLWSKNTLDFTGHINHLSMILQDFPQKMVILKVSWISHTLKVGAANWEKTPSNPVVLWPEHQGQCHSFFPIRQELGTRHAVDVDETAGLDVLDELTHLYHAEGGKNAHVHEDPGAETALFID